MAFSASQFYFSPLKCMVPNTVNEGLVQIGNNSGEVQGNHLFLSRPEILPEP